MMLPMKSIFLQRTLKLTKNSVPQLFLDMVPPKHKQPMDNQYIHTNCNASNKQQGAYLIFEAPGWALIRGGAYSRGRLFEVGAYSRHYGRVFRGPKGSLFIRRVYNVLQYLLRHHLDIS